MKKFLLCSFFLSLFYMNLFSQTNNSVKSNNLFISDNYEEKHYFVALTGSLLPSVICYSWNNYIIQAGWAKVDSEEMAEFYNRDLEYDTDWVSTNFLGHPFQGSMYYLAGRSSNLNPFESFAISVLGSYVWEFICEANAPSINDMAYTTIGAFALGEMLFKLSHEAGSKSYPLTYCLNPMQMYTDLLLGRNLNTVGGGNIYSLSIFTGISTAFGYDYPQSSLYSNQKESFPFMTKAGLEVIYKDPYVHEVNSVYDQFELSIYGGMGPGNGIPQEKPLEEEISYEVALFSNGVLKSINPDFEKTPDTVFGFSMLYDFIWNNFFEFTTLAPAVMIKQRISNDKSVFNYQVHLGFNVLGITEYNYYRKRYLNYTVPFRSYNYVYGLELFTQLCYEYNDKHFIRFDSHSYFSRDINEKRIDNDNGNELYSLNQLSYKYKLNNNVALGIQDDFYVKYTWFDLLPDFFSIYNSTMIFVQYYF